MGKFQKYGPASLTESQIEYDEFECKILYFYPLILNKNHH